MKFVYLILCLIIFSAKILAAEKPSAAVEYIEQSFDVIHYDLNLDLTSYPLKQCVGDNKIYFIMDNNEAGDFYFHLQDLQIDSVKLNGEIIQTEFHTNNSGDYYSVFVHSPADTNILRVFYQGIMTAEDNDANWGGVHAISNNIFSLGVAFKADYVSCARHFMPCYDHPSDKALFTCSIKVPQDIYAVSNGLLKEEIQEDDFNIFVWHQNKECSTYLLNFSVAKLITTEFGDNDPPIEVYSSKFVQEAVDYVFEPVEDMIDVYEEKFGEYPFEKCAYVLTSKGSMEHASLISLASSVVSQYYTDKDIYKYTVAHELAHQWFGNYVTPLDFRDAWLSEGFATFCEAVWRESLEGKNGLYRKISLDAENYTDDIIPYEGVLSLYDFDRTAPSSNYPQTIYNKGAVVLLMLMDKLGSDIFYEGINTYLNQYAYDNASTENFINVMETVSGQELDYFFDQWVYGKGYPVLDIEFEECDSYSGEGHCLERVTFNQIQNPDYGTYDSLSVIIEFERNDNTFFTQKFIVSGENSFHELGEDFVIKDIRGINNDLNFRSMVKIRNINIPLSVANQELADNIILSPNPAGDILHIDVRQNEFSSIEIYRIDGTLAMKISDEYITEKFDLNVKSLSTGSYILRLINNGSYVSKKLIISR